MKKITLSLALTMTLALGAGAATQHVKPGAGSAAWAGKQNVHENIAAAIAAAAVGDEIWVAQGAYSVSAALTWKNGVNVYGGFVGNEADKNLRSRDAALTVISRESGITRLLAATAALTTPTTWSGFTIQNSTGGGVQMHANCILDNCIVRNNACGTTFGGGIVADIGQNVSISADIVIQGCRIINNQISSGNRAGGGIYVGAAKASTGKFILKNSVIANNTGTNNGGGLAVNWITNEITNCTFAKNNRASGGWPGGAIYLNQTNQTTITNCIFWGNNDTYTNPHPDMFVELPGSGSAIKNCIVSRILTENTSGVVADIISAAGNTTLENITVLNTPTTNDELLFASPSATAGYTVNSEVNLNADWSILENSVAKDAGIVVVDVTPATDITGKGRPKFTAIDVGAYEYAAAIDIAANASSAVDYDAATMGNVTIHADNTGTGQWTAANTVVTDGVIKLVKTVEAGKVYAIGFPFAVSSVDKAFATLQAYSGATNRFTDAASIEAGRGYLVSFAAAGNVTFTSAPNPTLLTAYPEAAAEYKLAPSLSLQNAAGIDGAVKYYSYDPANATWGGAEDNITALSPFDAVVVSTAAADHYAAIGTGLAETKLATVSIAGEGHITIAEPAGASPYEMGVVGGAFDLKFGVGAGYVPSAVTIKTGTGQDEPYSLASPVSGIYTVSINPITDSAAITITTAKQQFDVTVTVPGGVNITLPEGGSSPYSVYYDSAFVLKLTLDEPANYFPLVALGSGDAFVPPTEGSGDVYVVTLSSVKQDTAITVTLAAKKTVTLTAGTGVTITAPAAVADSTYTVPEGSAFSYAFAVQAGYENPTVNGQPTLAGTHSLTVDNDTTLTIAASLAKWKVTLNTDGTLTGITLESGSAYPTGGYEVENGDNAAIEFKVTDGKYPAVTLPKGIAYVLTQAADVYTLTLPAVASNVNVGLLAQDEVALPKGVVPVKEDAFSKGASLGNSNTEDLYVINKGVNNGNSYSTHLKFDFSSFPLSELAQFPSIQLKLTTGWQANDAAGAQWLITETEDSWSETVPFLQSASPASVDTVGTFTFGDIHPATPAANVDIYVDLTDYVEKWLAAPERTTDKVLSLRIYNTWQTSNGGEVDLKSKEATGDFGPKLIFGSVNTAVTDLTLGGTSIYQAGRYAYFKEVTDSEIGTKMPAVGYTLSPEVDPKAVDVSVTYAPADSTITAGQKNSITLTVAPKAALKGEGLSRRYTVSYRVPMVIGATETKLQTDYINGSYGNITFNATDTSAGQLRVSDPSGLTVQGVVKVVRTFEADKLYAVGFPFDATSSVAPSELFTYDGTQLQAAASIEKDKGYLIKFAAAGEVTFTSAENPVLPQVPTVMPVTNADYRFVANPYTNNVFWVANMMSGGYYSYNSEGHYFQRISTTATSYIQVKPFEGIIVSTSRTAEYISLSGSKLPHNVTWTKSAGVSITSGQAASTVVPYDSAYVLTFTVDSCYDAPAVTVGGSAYTLDAPDAAGAYTVRIGAVTTDTAIDILAAVKTFAVTVANTANVTLTEGHDTTLSCGTPYTVKFTVAGGVTPAVTVNAAPYTLEAPVNDVYTVAVTVSSPTAISITAAAPRQVTVTADDSYITLLSSSGQATAASGVYEVADGSAFMVTFKLAAGYGTPQSTGAAITGPDAGGVYAATIGAVTGDSAISITASLKNYSVQVNTGAVAQVTEPAAAPYTVEHGSAFTLKFTLTAGYENPQVAIGSAPYTPSLDSASGAYTVTTGAITSDTAISVTASLKRVGVTVTSDSSVTVIDVPSDVAHGDALTFTFTLSAHYANPQVTVNNTSYTLAEPANGVYTVTVPNVTEAVSVSVSASLELVNVTIAASHVTVTSPTGAGPYAVPYGSEYTVTFTVNENYENPQVTVNGASYAPAAPVNGVYTVTGHISEATEVSITASPVMFDLTLTAGANITLVTPAAAGAIPVAYGEAFTVSFRVAAGYTPALKTDGLTVAVGEPAEGVYTVTAVPSVTGEHLVEITATGGATSVYKEDPSDPVARVQYYTLGGLEVKEPTAATGIYIVKRIHASKKATVRKELIVKTN